MVDPQLPGDGGTARPSPANRTILARTTVRAGAIRERASGSMGWISSADLGRARDANGHLPTKVPRHSRHYGLLGGCTT